MAAKKAAKKAPSGARMTRKGLVGGTEGPKKVEALLASRKPETKPVTVELSVGDRISYAGLYDRAVAPKVGAVKRGDVFHLGPCPEGKTPADLGCKGVVSLRVACDLLPTGDWELEPKASS